MVNISIPTSPSVQETSDIAAGSTLGLEQGLLAASGQPGLTILAVGFTTSGRAQGISLGNGNVVEVYASGADFNAGTVLYREFMSLGEPIIFTGLSNGAIITSTQGFYGFSECINGNNESPMPLLSYGLSFKETFFYAFRSSALFNPNVPTQNNTGYIHIVNGPLANTIKMTNGSGTVIQGQENIELDPWQATVLGTSGNTEYIISGTQNMMACTYSDDALLDARLIMPLTNDGITWPRSGFVSAPYNDTKVDWYVRDGARSINIQGIFDTHWEAFFDNQDAAIGITITTPSVAPASGKKEVLWESGGTGTGMSLLLNDAMQLELRFSTATASPRLTSTATLTTSTNYAIVTEFDQTNDLVSLFISSGSTDYTFYTGGAAVADSTVSSTATDMCGTGDTGIGAASAADIGGYQAPDGDRNVFKGSIVDVQIGDLLLATVDRTYTWATDATTSDTRMNVSPGSFVDFDNGTVGTGASDADYESNGATRVLATGLISAYSGADSSGSEATPLMLTSAMSQIVAQPLHITDSGDGGNSSVSIASPYEGTARVYEWNDTTSSLDLAYTVPLTRNNVTIFGPEEQLHPAAGQIANEGTASNTLVGQLNAGVIIADVPITAVVQNNTQNVAVTIRSQNGTTASVIQNQADETLSLGITPETSKFVGTVPYQKMEMHTRADGLKVIRDVDNSGVETWRVA